MTTQIKIGLGVFLLALSFAAGRLSAAKPEVKTDVVTKTDDTQHEVKDTQTKTVIVKQPNGTETTTTETNTVTKILTVDVGNTETKTDVIPPKVSTLNISVLAGENFSTHQEAFGLSITKKVLGPVSAGVWGINNGMIGVSLGLSF